MQNFIDYLRARKPLIIMPLICLICAAYAGWNDYKFNDALIEASIQGNPAAIEILAKYNKPSNLNSRLVSEALNGNEHAMKVLRLDIPQQKEDTNKKEPTIQKPALLYHGSSTGNIDTLEPRKRYTPGNETNSPEAIYATDDPAFAAAHAFPWSSSEGINLYYDVDETKEGMICVHLEVPAALFDRLNQPIYIYTLNSNTFTWVLEEVVGRTYRSLEAVHPLSTQHFNTVIEAIESFGGKVIKICTVEDLKPPTKK